MRALLAAVVAVLLLAAPAAAADDKLTFDTAPAVAGQSADSVYQSTPGFIFGGGVENPPGGDFPSYHTCGTSVAALAAAPSAPNVAFLSCGGSTEFPDPPVLFAKTTRTTRSSVSVKVGDSRDGHHVMRLSAFDDRGKLLSRSASKPITAAGTLLEVGPGNPDITYFTVEETGDSSARGVWVDDVTADIPPIKGKPSFGIFRTAGGGTVTVRQGETATLDISLYRINASEGNATFKATEAPAGVAANADAPSTNGRTLTIKAGIGATPTVLGDDKTLTIVATPANANTGTTPQRISIPIRVTPAIEVVANPKSTPLPSCGGIDVFYTVAADAGPAFFSMPGLPDGVSATIDGKPIAAAPPVTGRGSAKLDFTLSRDVPADAIGTLTLTGPQGTDPVSGIRVNYAGTAPIRFRALKPLTDLTPTVAQTPRELRPGTLVTVRGEAGCIGPNLRLRFGNDKALAPILGNDGGVLSATVPRLATPGPVQLVALDGDVINAGRAEGPFLQVDDYRNAVGFDFRNYTPKLTVDQMVREYGRDQVYFTPNICGTLSFGLFSCKVGTPIPDPWAMVVLGIANATMGGGDGGACFGISVTSQQIRQGKLALAGLGNAGATTAFGLGTFGLDSPPGGLNEVINANHLGELSAEYVDYYAKRTVNNVAFQSPSSLRREIEDALRAGDDPLLSLRDRGSTSRLHVVVAYDLYTDPSDPSAYFIDIYDSRTPYRDAPTTRSNKSGMPLIDDKKNPVVDGDETLPDGTVHAERHGGSRIRVAGDGTWASDGTWGLPEGSKRANKPYTGLSVDTIIPSRFGTPPAKPTLITATQAAKGIGTILLGWSANVAANVFRAEAPGGDAPSTDALPAHVTQISSGGRHLYTDTGEINHDPATALRGAPWTPSVGDDSTDAEGFILASGPGASYTVDVGGDRDAAQTRTVLGEDMVAQVTTNAKPGVTDAFTVTPRDDAVAYDPGTESGPLKVQMMVRDAGETRSAEITTMTTGKDEVSYDDGDIVVSHTGPAAKVDLTLSSTSASALPVAVSTKLVVGRNSRTTLTPASWKQLAKGKLRVRSGRKVRQVGLRRKHARGAKLTRLSVLKGRVKAKVRVPASVVSGTATVTLILKRGKRAVASTSVPAGSAGARTVGWKLPKQARKGDDVVAVATTLVASGSSFNSATSQKQARVR